ncbi:unnamed protein product, partial [Closterium sp. Naga37s-1]
RAIPLFLLAGGVAHNIAECMAALSAAPFLISAVGDDAAGRPMAHPFFPSSVLPHISLPASPQFPPCFPSFPSLFLRDTNEDFLAQQLAEAHHPMPRS